MRFNKLWIAAHIEWTQSEATLWMSLYSHYVSLSFTGILLGFLPTIRLSTYPFSVFTTCLSSLGEDCVFLFTMLSQLFPMPACLRSFCFFFCPPLILSSPYSSVLLLTPLSLQVLIAGILLIITSNWLVSHSSNDCINLLVTTVLFLFNHAMTLSSLSLPLEKKKMYSACLLIACVWVFVTHVLACECLSVSLTLSDF